MPGRGRVRHQQRRLQPSVFKSTWQLQLRVPHRLHSVGRQIQLPGSRFGCHSLLPSHWASTWRLLALFKSARQRRIQARNHLHSPLSQRLRVPPAQAAIDLASQPGVQQPGHFARREKYHALQPAIQQRIGHAPRLESHSSPSAR